MTNLRDGTEDRIQTTEKPKKHETESTNLTSSHLDLAQY